MGKVISRCHPHGAGPCASLRRGEHKMLEVGLGFGLKTFENFVKRIEDTDGKPTINPHFKAPISELWILQESRLGYSFHTDGNILLGKPMQCPT